MELELNLGIPLDLENEIESIYRDLMYINRLDIPCDIKYHMSHLLKGMGKDFIYLPKTQLNQKLTQAII